MTERLYYQDAYLTRFEALIVEVTTLDGAPAVVLDRSAFYPTGGGQPHDTGVLNGVAVLEVLERSSDGAVLHRLAAPLPPATHRVEGMIDWPRRFDHTQQHTGQHLLSQAFRRTAGAQTVSFHLGSEACTIDLDREHLSHEELAAAEDLANEVVFSDRPVAARFVSPEELAVLPMRKPAEARGAVRVVMVEGFDWSACGGTHGRRTGEVGLIKIAAAQKRGTETRVTFCCGWRALRWFQKLYAANRGLALDFSVPVEELPAAVRRLQVELKAARKEQRELAEQLWAYRAQHLLADAERLGRFWLICREFNDTSADELLYLATAMTAEPGRVMLAGTGGERAHLLFACSDDAPLDMSALLKEATPLIGGGGGGGRTLAQGGGRKPEGVPAALAAARERVRASLAPAAEVPWQRSPP